VEPVTNSLLVVQRVRCSMLLNKQQCNRIIYSKE
jgi:hypothetical protein